MNYIIREASLADTEAIWMLNCTEMGYPFPLEATRDKLEKLLRRDCDRRPHPRQRRLHRGRRHPQLHLLRLRLHPYRGAHHGCNHRRVCLRL